MGKLSQLRKAILANPEQWYERKTGTTIVQDYTRGTYRTNVPYVYYWIKPARLENGKWVPAKIVEANPKSYTRFVYSVLASVGHIRKDNADFFRAYIL